MKVLTVIGTRPEAIKMAPVLRGLREHADKIESVICATAQHREMLDQVLQLFDIRPDFDLDVMRDRQGLTELTSSLLQALGTVVERVKPDIVLVQGDTTTVMAASMVAYYHRIPVGHVEAGLRTGDRYRPFPEEMNRRVTDALTELYFAPTETARENLLGENVDDRRIVVTGNTVIDALLYVASLPYDWATGPLREVPTSKRIVAVTAHRRESFGQPFREICRAIRLLAEEYGESCHFVYPVHLNPAVQDPVREILSGADGISLVEPLDYLSFVHLLKRSTLVLTDSGGVQEEAPALNVPVLVIRDTTERPEGLAAGTSRLIGTSFDEIVAGVRALMDSPSERARMAAAPNPFGDGSAAGRIVSRLLKHAESIPGSPANLVSVG